LNRRATNWLRFIENSERPPFFAICGYTTTPRQWAYVDRRVDEHLLYLMTRNTIACDIKAGPTALSPGHLCWLAPGVRHGFKVADTNQRQKTRLGNGHRR